MIKLENNIESLDPKSSLSFLDNVDAFHTVSKSVKIKSSEDIWKIDNFLSNEECDEILLKCETEGFTELTFRPSKRLIAFDNNKNLTQTIKNRLDNESLNQKFVKPYGFYTDLINWDKNIKINPCIRVNKYIDSGFDLYRDAQFTKSYYARSNYTLVIYLNDNYEHGETCFISLKVKQDNNDNNNNGKTVNEEMTDMEYDRIEIKPKKGMAIIFDF